MTMVGLALRDPMLNKRLRLETVVRAHGHEMTRQDWAIENEIATRRRLMIDSSAAGFPELAEKHDSKMNEFIAMRESYVVQALKEIEE